MLDEVFLYMDASTAPKRPGWLDELEGAAEASAPLSVLGGQHERSALWVADDAFRNHLGRNAIYNTSSALVRFGVSSEEPALSFDVALARDQASYGSTFPEAYVANSAVGYCDDAVVFLSELDAVSEIDASPAIVSGGIPAIAGHDVSLLLQGLSVEAAPPAVPGFVKVIAVALNVTACDVAGRAPTRYFVMLPAANLNPDERVRVPFEPQTGLPYAFEGFPDRVVYEKTVVSEWCAASPSALTAPAYVDHLKHVQVSNVMPQAAAWTLPPWPVKFRPARCQGGAECPCRWPFAWNGRKFELGQCAAGGGPDDLWCPVPRAVSSTSLAPAAFDWASCSPLPMLAAVESSAVQTAATGNQTLKCPRFNVCNDDYVVSVALWAFLVVAALILGFVVGSARFPPRNQQDTREQDQPQKLLMKFKA